MSEAPGFFETIAIDALALGRKNELDIASHEDLCAERYANINTSVGEIKSILKWAGTTGFLIILGLLSFLAKLTWDATTQAQSTASTKIELLQRQLDARPPVIAAPPTASPPAN